MRRGVFVMVVIALLLGSCAVAQTQMLLYAGGEADNLSAVAVAQDGRMLMTGHTASSDGDFAFRTKTGRSGWVICTDAQGKMLWQFCSRHGGGSWMTAPRFLYDGSATVLLKEGNKNAELLRFDRAGELLERRMIVDEREGVSVYPVLTPAGYLIGRLGEPALLMDFEGENVETLDFSFYGESMAHGRAVAAKYEGKQWVFVQDEAGAYAPLCGIDHLVVVNVLSLADGGVMGHGFWPSGEEMLVRWDAQGNQLHCTDVSAQRPLMLFETSQGVGVITMEDANRRLLILNELGDIIREFVIDVPPDTWNWGEPAMREDGMLAIPFSRGAAYDSWDAGVALTPLE